MHRGPSGGEGTATLYTMLTQPPFKPLVKDLDARRSSHSPSTRQGRKPKPDPVTGITSSLDTSEIAWERHGNYNPLVMIRAKTLSSGKAGSHGWAHSRFSLGCAVWKSVSGLSLQEGGFESVLFLRDNSSCEFDGGVSGTVLKIC